MSCYLNANLNETKSTNPSSKTPPSNGSANWAMPSATGRSWPRRAGAERDSFAEVVLAGRLRGDQAAEPSHTEEAREDALRKVRVGTPALTQSNRALSPSAARRRACGIPARRRRHCRRSCAAGGFDAVGANDWLAVNQFTVIEGSTNWRPDIVVFVNGLPLGLIELKNAADEEATIWSAYAQLQTYKGGDFPAAALQRGAGGERRFAGAHGFGDGEPEVVQGPAHDRWADGCAPVAGAGGADQGAFDRRRFLDLLQHFIVFEEDPDTGRCTRSSPATISSTR